jgi:hypothetical protein
MLTPYIYAALAHERHQRFLTETETGRRARQARLHRRQADISGARRSPMRRRPAWLQSGWSGQLGHWPRSAVTGRPVVLRDGPAGEYTPAGSPSSSDDPAGRLPESAAITIVTETRPTTARSSPDRLSSYDTYSGWAQQGTAQQAWSCPLGTE